MKKENIKKLMKGIKRVKWENIFFILDIIITCLCLKHHIQLNGFYLNIGIEIIVYLSFGLVFRYIIKDIRKNPENWFFDKD